MHRIRFPNQDGFIAIAIATVVVTVVVVVAVTAVVGVGVTVTLAGVDIVTAAGVAIRVCITQQYDMIDIALVYWN